MNKVSDKYIEQLEKAHGSIAMTLGVLKAVEQGQYIPSENLIQSAKSMSATVHPSKKDHIKGYIFASGKVNRLKNIGYQSYTAELTQSSLQLASIADTQATQFIEEGTFIAHLARSLDAENSPFTESDIMHGYIQSDQSRAPGIWDHYSAQYAANATGHAVTVTPNSDPERVFVKSELPILLGYQKLETMNGKPFELFLDYKTALENAGYTGPELYQIIDKDLVQGTSIEYMRSFSKGFQKSLEVPVKHDFNKTFSDDINALYKEAGNDRSYQNTDTEFENTITTPAH